MKKEVNLGHFIAFIVGILLPLIAWGINVETRFEQVNHNTNDILEIKSDTKIMSDLVQKNHIEVMKQFTDVKLQLKDKKDRE